VGLSRMLLDSKLSEEQRQHMQTINVSAITLGNIFNDIIDMDKFDRRKLELFPTPILFDDFVSEMDSISSLMAHQKGLRFSLERLSELPFGIEVDATRLRQVLWNLISNAMKFTKEGGVVVSVSAEIEQNRTASIEFQVEDSGIGIPKSELDKIFAMYYQVKSDKDNLHAVGTGIGLAVSAQLVKMMGGEIDVSSEEGYGSTFTVTIQVPLADEKSLLPKPMVSTRNLNIFMVEDIELNVTVACALLESLGHKVTVAMTGKEAQEKFNPEQFDMVFLDIQLPDMTGFEVANYYREVYANLPPLVALTANSISNKKDYLERGMDDAISKPLSVEAVQEVILKFENELESEVVMKDTSSNESTPSADSKDIYVHLLDLDMLESYIGIVGPEPMQESVKMFEELMPGYVEVLTSNLTAKDQKGIVSEAHKIKGAAGSVGLKHIQQIAQKAQSPDTPAWSENIADWVEEIKNEYLHDVQVLKEWLSHR